MNHPLHDPTDHSSSSARATPDPLAGCRVAITGGTSGLGLALVRHLHDRGARIAFVARHRDDVARVAARHEGSHGIAGDVSSKTDIYPIAMQILGALGGLDVLVNNASDLGPVPLALLADTACEDFDRALATNVLGPFRLTKALLGALAAAAREGSGALVLNVSSDAAVEPYSALGRVRREQGGAAASEPDLERGAAGRRDRRAHARPGRHGHAAARSRRARRRSDRRCKHPDTAAGELADAIGRGPGKPDGRSSAAAGGPMIPARLPIQRPAGARLLVAGRTGRARTLAPRTTSCDSSATATS